jgi:hypothetical protein
LATTLNERKKLSMPKSISLINQWYKKMVKYVIANTLYVKTYMMFYHGMVQFGEVATYQFTITRNISCCLNGQKVDFCSSVTNLSQQSFAS